MKLLSMAKPTMLQLQTYDLRASLRKSTSLNQLIIAGIVEVILCSGSGRRTSSLFKFTAFKCGWLRTTSPRRSSSTAEANVASDNNVPVSTPVAVKTRPTVHNPIIIMHV